VIDRAAAEINQEKYSEAEQILRPALAAHPRDARALGLMGVALDAQQRFDEAEGCYTRALEVDPHSVSVLNNLGNHYLQLHQPDRARSAFLRVIAIEPNHANANLQLAEFSLAAKQGEAALKYLLLGAFSSGIFAYGLSLFYGLTGSTNLGAISHWLLLHSQESGYKPVLIIALLTTITGLLFKIAAVPFHQWAPDAYEGAPTSITGFMSVAVKAAGWAMLLRILLWGLYPMRSLWLPLLIFVSIATMTGANFAALTQTNTKRLLAYSSIAHVGYMLLGLVAGTATDLNADGIKGILIYLLVYTFMNLGAFGVLTSLRHRNVVGDELDDLNGLYSRAPVEAVLMLVFMLSLAGIPPLAGFWGKYFIFLGLIESQHYALAALGVLYSVFGLYYYLKIANAMFMRQPEKGEEKLPISLAMRAALGLTGLATLYIGIMPNRFIELVNWALGIAQNPSVAKLVR
jgi:NADH-quinone oxidoreductase subunit N